MIGRVGLILAMAAADASAAPARIGFVNLTEDTAGETTIAWLRAELEGRRDVVAGPPRPELERPHVARAERDLDLRDARAAYQRFDTKGALAAIDRAAEAREHAAPSAELFEQLSELELLRGEVLAGGGRTAQAIAAFARVHRLAPSRTALDGAKYPPAVRELYAKGVAAARAGKATLTVAAPAGATVWIDGKPAGTAPVPPREVGAGDHLVVVTRPGYRTERAWARGEVAIDLEVLPEAERLSALRDALSPNTLDFEVLGALTVAAAADVLVVVARRDTAIAIAVYDHRTKKLGSWQPPGPDILGKELGPSRRRERPWYRTWWGLGLVGGGLAVLTTVIVVEASASPDPPYKIGGFEWTF